MTRGLLEEWERAAGGGGGGGELKLDADQDETREKFRIVKVLLAGMWQSHSDGRLGECIYSRRCSESPNCTAFVPSCSWKVRVAPRTGRLQRQMLYPCVQEPFKTLLISHDQCVQHHPSAAYTMQCPSVAERCCNRVAPSLRRSPGVSD